MRLLLPDNFYAKIFSYLFPSLSERDISYYPSASLGRFLDEDKADLALIPSMDLLTYPSFFVSGRTAVSFDGALSNSYFYFLKQIRMVKEVFLRGDVSKNEAILTKIIFSEQFDSNVDIVLDSKPFDLNSKNYLVCGDENLRTGNYDVGLSMADQVSDLIDAPYVNYILVSKEQEILKEFTKGITGLDKFLEDNFEVITKKLDYSQSAVQNIKENINSIYFDMTENEKKALTDLIRLPYFTGLMEDIHDINFVD